MKKLNAVFVFGCGVGAVTQMAVASEPNPNGDVTPYKDACISEYQDCDYLTDLDDNLSKTFHAVRYGKDAKVIVNYSLTTRSFNVTPYVNNTRPHPH